MQIHKIGLGIALGVALGIAAPSFAQQAVQWRVEDGGNGHWYGLVNLSAPSTWAQARAYAISLGGDLVSITGADLQALVVPLLGAAIVPNGAGGVWIGAYQLPGDPEPGGFRWVNGAPFAYTGPGWVPSNCCSSCPGESGENYVTIASQIDSLTYHGGAGVIGWWNDVGCVGAQAALFEWSADCNADGIVDYGQCRDGSLPDYDGDNIPDCCEAGTPCTVGSYPVQWRVEEGGNGHWYAKVAASPLPTTIAAMQGIAAGRGADLASITSSGENATILSLLGAIGAGESHSAWIGLYRPMPGDPWRWTDGSATTWGGWGSASCVSGPYPNDMPFPGELGTVIYRQNCGLVWDDSATAWIQNPPPWWGGVANMTLVLEWSADCDADGVVDYGQILQGQLVDADSNGIPDNCEIDPCPGDVTDNGVVDGVDLSLILALWGTSGQKFPRSDANGDGIVDANDLAIVLSGWGNCPD